MRERHTTAYAMATGIVLKTILAGDVQVAGAIQVEIEGVFKQLLRGETLEGGGKSISLPGDDKATVAWNDIILQAIEEAEPEVRHGSEASYNDEPKGYVE